MKFLDRHLGLDPEKAQYGNPDYDAYRTGVFTLKASGVVLAAAGVFDAVGLGVPAGIALVAGVGGLTIGSAEMALHTGKLSAESNQQSHIV